MQQGNAYKKFDTIFHSGFLILGLAMIIGFVFDILVPVYFVVLGVLNLIAGIAGIFHTKKDRYDEKYTS
ncbi:hypothetical protein AAV35_000610 [Salimicrobium jeotgali]|uniref:Uncharacterized protein n=2 Tax=Salimicrobium TaxID=351195 RepID=K2H4D7_9BACI|nr:MULTISPECIES: hypothetical protein [Salimicrobium]AKG03425.1 hypothetical protein AAV35_000610 [Salimicrobium jeotgali]EKE30740.1 hypothetical protein MJ3_12260 [Salimicrobium jeotgali]MBM7697130.1 hypothetical protein [Salimicrobium jeotgali]PBB06890.1 hypothetical protein CKW00_00065 [Salimicrobium humidisoli]